MLFASCQVLEYCGENCKTELKLCYGSCGKNIEGKMTDNVIDFLPNVQLESSCNASCAANTNCTHYTHYAQDRKSFSNLCVLLTSVQPPFKECESCVTSFPDCKVTHF